MRILVITDLFPPVAFGGYERECATVVEHLRARHEVLVLTSDARAGELAREPGVLRALPFLDGGRVHETLRAPAVALRAARTTRRVLGRFDPELVFAWEAIAIPQAALAVAAERRGPMAYRFCVPFAAEVFTGDR